MLVKRQPTTVPAMIDRLLTLVQISQLPTISFGLGQSDRRRQRNREAKARGVAVRQYDRHRELAQHWKHDRRVRSIREDHQQHHHGNATFGDICRSQRPDQRHSATGCKCADMISPPRHLCRFELIGFRFSANTLSTPLFHRLPSISYAPKCPKMTLLP